MKVWYVTMQFPAPSETFAGSDVRALRRSGAEVSVHSLRPAHENAEGMLAERGLNATEVTHGGPAEALRGLGVGLTRPGLLLGLLGWLFRHTRDNPDHLLRSLVLVPRTLELFARTERAKPEVVHLFWGHYPAMVAHLVQKYLPETVVSVFLGAYDLEMNYGPSAPVARNADVVWTHARVNLPALKRLGIPEERIRVAYRGLELSPFQEKPPVEKVPHRLVTAGRLIPSKGIGDVLEVLARVLEKWPDATLIVLGDGPAREALEAQAKCLGVAHAVTFRGHVSHETVLEEMTAAEVFLFMSKKPSERLPNVVKEAVASRCLCIATRTPGMDELLVDGAYGFVIDQGDVAAAAGHIDATFAKEGAGEGSTEAMTMAAYQHLEEHFDVDRIMAAYHAQWRRLHAAKAPAERAKAVPAKAS